MKRAASAPVAAFEQAWRVARGPDLEREVQFHAARKWRFDYAHRGSMVAIEIDGGIMQSGRHNRGVKSTLNARGERERHGYLADCEKLNAAVALGWRVFRLAGDMVDDLEQIEQIALCIRKECWSPESVPTIRIKLPPDPEECTEPEPSEEEAREAEASAIDIESLPTFAIGGKGGIIPS